MNKAPGHRPRHIARLIVAGMMACVSSLLLMTFLYNELIGSSRPSDVPTGLIVRYVLVMACGGFLAGYLLAGMFGRRGLVGWPLALLGGALATTGSGLAGSFIWRFPGLMSDGWQADDFFAIAAGATVLPFALSDWPLLILLWPATIFATHLWVRQLR